MSIIAFVVAGFAVGLAFGFLLFRSARAYREGWQHGERYGRSEGYKQAWLKRHKPLLSAETEDWNDDA